MSYKAQGKAKRPLMSESEFARHVGRSQPTVAGWIKNGRLTEDAIVDGKIHVERAKAELALSLDSRKQKLGSTSRPILGARASNPAALARRRKAEAEIAELTAEKKRRELMVATGKWIATEEFEKQAGRELAELIANNEQFLFNEFANEVANKHNLDRRLVVAELRQRWREFRGEASAKAYCPELNPVENI